MTSPLQTPKQILDSAVERAWSAETSASDEWNPANPALGQCAVTACVRRDYLGGDIWNQMVTLPDGSTESHYFNVFDGQPDDKTKLQFPDGTTFGDAGPKIKEFDSTYDYVLSSKATRKRYDNLSKAVRRIIAAESNRLV